MFDFTASDYFYTLLQVCSFLFHRIGFIQNSIYVVGSYSINLCNKNTIAPTHELSSIFNRVIGSHIFEIVPNLT